MTTVTVEETKKFGVEDVISRSPIADLPTAYSSVRNFLRWSSQVFVGRVDGEIACVWGLMRPSVLSGSGYLWFLTTDLADQHKFLLIRNSQREIEKLLALYPILEGECAIDDKRAQRWLRFLGAKFGFPGPRTIPFQIEKR